MIYIRRSARIISHLYQVDNMMILTKKINNISLEDMYISKDLEDIKMSKPMKMFKPLNLLNSYKNSFVLAKQFS